MSRVVKFRVRVNGAWRYFGAMEAPDLENGDIIVSDSLGQYTGLTDKNGKEIYEGDVLSSVGVVRWGHQGWETELDSDSSLTLFEVIGNVYENPELLPS